MMIGKSKTIFCILLFIAFAVFARADMSSCSSYNGVVCESPKQCFDGMNVSSADSDGCCIGGHCMIEGEYVEALYQLTSQPSMTMTPSGIFASEVTDIGIDEYCTDNLNGSLCLADQYCKGRSIEYYLSKHCCLDVCVLLPEGSFGPISDEEGIGIDEMFEEDWEYAEREQDNVSEVAPELPEELPEDALPLEEEKGFVDYAGDKIETVTDNLNLIHVVGIVLGIVLLVMLAVALFRRNTGKKIQSEEQAQMSVPDTSGLQSEISILTSKGYTYQQVRQIMVNKGHYSVIVDAEIRKYYQSRQKSVTR